MPTHEEIKKIAREYALKVYPKEPMEDIGQMQFLRDTFVKNATEVISLLSEDYCLVPKTAIENNNDVESLFG